MRSTLGTVLVLALLSACAGPRLSAPAATASLPKPVVQRVTAPVRCEGVPWPVLPVAESSVPCDT